MSDAPKHIWPGEEELDGINMREWAGDYRYTLTSGPEWDALMARARTAASGDGYAERVMKTVLAYFEEPSDE